MHFISVVSRFGSSPPKPQVVVGKGEREKVSREHDQQRGWTEAAAAALIAAAAALGVHNNR